MEPSLPGPAPWVCLPLNGVRALIQSVSCPIVFGGLLLVCLKYADYDLLNWEAQPLTRGCQVAFTAPKLPLPGRENSQSHVDWRCGFRALHGEKSSHKNLSFQIPEKEGLGSWGSPQVRRRQSRHLLLVRCFGLRPLTFCGLHFKQLFSNVKMCSEKAK